MSSSSATACSRSPFGLAGLVGWFLSPTAALAIFLFFPIFYVVRLQRVTRG